MYYQVVNKTDKIIKIGKSEIIPKGAVMLHESITPDGYKNLAKNRLIIIEDIQENKVQENKVQENDLNSKNYKQLIEMAREMGLKPEKNIRKDKLIASIKEAKKG